jgi:protein-disulfide isomerase
VTRASNILLVCLMTIGLASCTKNSGSGGSGDENTTFAVVNGQEIKGKDVLPKIENDLAELNRNAYELKKRATEEVIQQRILNDEAKKQGTTIDKLFSQFDSLRDKEVGPADVDAFLKQRNIDVKKLSKQEKESVPNIIKMQRVYEARQRYVSELRAKANVQFKIPKPAEKVVEVGVGSGPAKGNASAKVTIIEFSDFQCPFCARGRQRIDEIYAKYKDKVRIYYRHFPLESIHPQAMGSAKASACAHDQGKFWEYHDKLFDNQQKLDDKSLVEYANALGLDSAKFQACLKSDAPTSVVRKDVEDASKLGVNSTPTFFVNGRAVRGAQPIEAFSEIIDEELSK